MLDYILAFFAVVGISLLAIRVFEFLFYRKRDYNFPVIVDLRGKTEAEAVERFEVLNVVRRKSCGRAAISDLVVLYDVGNPELHEYMLYAAMRVFDLTGVVYAEGDETWMKPYRSISEGENGSSVENSEN